LQKIDAKLIAKKQLTDNIYQLKFVCLLGKFSFQSGQYLLVEKETDGKKIKRAYSISSTVEDMPEFELTVRRFEGGVMSTWLTDLVPDDEVEFYGPLGVFTADLGNNNSKVMVAIGCGIAPLKSIIERLLKKNGYQVDLFYGNRFVSGVPYHNYFQQLVGKYKGFRYFPCISRLDQLISGVYAGRVNDVMSEFIIDYSNRDYYLCGSKEMIGQVRDFLIKKGADEKSIYFEQIFI
jgi:ferredoxin-NADP reductase